MAKISIDGKQYDTDALSDEAKANIKNVQYCEQRMGELKRELSIVQTARNAYAQVLKGALPKDA